MQLKILGFGECKLNRFIQKVLRLSNRAREKDDKLKKFH